MHQYLIASKDIMSAFVHAIVEERFHGGAAADGFVQRYVNDLARNIAADLLEGKEVEMVVDGRVTIVRVHEYAQIIPSVKWVVCVAIEVLYAPHFACDPALRPTTSSGAVDDQLVARLWAQRPQVK
jgi:hypothetical protein